MEEQTKEHSSKIPSIFLWNSSVNVNVYMEFYDTTRNQLLFIHFWCSTSLNPTTITDDLLCWCIREREGQNWKNCFQINHLIYSVAALTGHHLFLYLKPRAILSYFVAQKFLPAVFFPRQCAFNRNLWHLDSCSIYFYYILWWWYIFYYTHAHLILSFIFRSNIAAAPYTEVAADRWKNMPWPC